MYYSELEKRAIITMANKMVLADGEVRIEELASAGRTLDLMMGFTKEDSLLRELPFNQAKSVIDGFPENKKRATAALLISIMISDNDVAEEEAVLLDHISDFCGLPRLNFEEYQDALAEMVYDKLVKIEGCSPDKVLCVAQNIRSVCLLNSNPIHYHEEYIDYDVHHQCLSKKNYILATFSLIIWAFQVSCPNMLRF